MLKEIYLFSSLSFYRVNGLRRKLLSNRYKILFHYFFSSSSSVTASLHIETLLVLTLLCFLGSGTEYRLYSAYSSTSSGHTSTT